MSIGKWRPLVIVLVLLAGACATTPVHMPGAVPSPFAGRPSTVDAFGWSPDRRLTWADFRGPVDARSAAVATTATVVDYQMSCEGTQFFWRVESRFLPRVSWVKASHLMIPQSAQTLLHEQGHFDLSEVHARRARETLRRLPDPCALTEAQQNALIQGFHQQAGTLQMQYDRETAHGTDLRRQREWQGRVETWLRTLPH
jgi:hypothetical protein